MKTKWMVLCSVLLAFHGVPVAFGESEIQPKPLHVFGYGNVVAADVSGDGKLCAAAFGDRRVRLYDMTNGELIHVFPQEDYAVSKVIFSPDAGKLLVATAECMRVGYDEEDYGGGFVLWDVRTRESVLASKGQDAPVWNAIFSADGAKFAYHFGKEVHPGQSPEHGIAVCNAATGNVLEMVDGLDSTVLLFRHPSGKFGWHTIPYYWNEERIGGIRCAPREQLIWSQNIKTIESAFLLMCHEVLYSPNGKNAVFLSRTPDILDVYEELHPQSRIARIQLDQSIHGASTVSCFSITKDSQHLLVGAERYMLKYGLDGTMLSRIEEDSTLLLLKMLEDDTTVVSVTEFGRIAFRDFKDDRELRAFEIGKTKSSDVVMETTDGRILCRTFLPSTKKALVYDPYDGTELYSINGSVKASSPNGTQLLVNQEGRLWVCDAASGKNVKALPETADADWRYCMPWLGKMDALIFSEKEGDRLVLWSVGSGQVLQTFPASSTSFRSISVSPDETKLIISTNMGKGWEAVVWSLSTGERLHVFNMEESWEGRWFSSDGKWVLAPVNKFGDGPLKAWDVETFLPAEEGVFLSSGIMSLDGTLFLEQLDESGTAKLLDAKTGKVLHTLEHFSWGSIPFTLSPDGRKILSSMDESFTVGAKLWDVETGKLICEYKENSVSNVGVKYAIFSRDGKRIIAGTRSGIIVWETAKL